MNRYVCLLLILLTFFVTTTSGHTVLKDSTSVKSKLLDLNRTLTVITDIKITLQSPLPVVKVMQTYHFMKFDRHTFDCSYTLTFVRGRDTISTEITDVYKSINWKEFEEVRQMTPVGDWVTIWISFKSGEEIRRIRHSETRNNRKRESAKYAFLFLSVPVDNLDEIIARLKDLSVASF